MGSAGFSLRESLINQGVTTEEGVREHLALCHKLQQVNPALRTHRYRVNPNVPNDASAPYSG